MVQLVALRLQTTQVLRLVPDGHLILLNLGPVVALQAIAPGVGQNLGGAHGPGRASTLWARLVTSQAV